MLKSLNRFVLIAAAALTLAACQGDGRLGNAKAYAPIPMKLVKQMTEKGMSPADPILIRSYKKEAEVEIWKRDNKGEYALLKTYPICRWSGQLGPKVREGDRQVPEGFYAITPAQMNPNSSFYLSFDVGFPNAFDRANGRSGSYLMVHGACSSRGCFSMTDEQIAEIYAVGREAFAGGQRSFQFQSYPFRMTAENLAKHRNDPNISFWRNLKEGSDAFEVTKQEPVVGVCNKRYVFDARPAGGGRLDPSASCPPLSVDPNIADAVKKKEHQDDQQVAELVSKGTRAIKLVYDDGGQHPSFRATAYASSSQEGSVFAQGPSGPSYGEVSRPEALARGPQEIVQDDAPAGRRAPTAVAAVPPKPEAEPEAAASTAVAARPASAPAVAKAQGGREPAAEAVTQLAKSEAKDRPADAATVTSLAPPETTGSTASAATAFVKRALSLEGLLASKKKDDAATAAPAAQDAPEQAKRSDTRASASSAPQAGSVMYYAPPDR